MNNQLFYNDEYEKIVLNMMLIDNSVIDVISTQLTDECFYSVLNGLPSDKPIFIKNDAIFNSTINGVLEKHCINANVPTITIHGLRHTHASLLLFGGVSIASVAKRLGHSSMNTTEKTYLHIIQELENKDVDLVMRSLSGLC